MRSPTVLSGAQKKALVKRINGRRVVVSVSTGKDSVAASLHLTELGIEYDRISRRAPGGDQRR